MGKGMGVGRAGVGVGGYAWERRQQSAGKAGTTLQTPSGAYSPCWPGLASGFPRRLGRWPCLLAGQQVVAVLSVGTTELDSGWHTPAVLAPRRLTRSFVGFFYARSSAQETEVTEYGYFFPLIGPPNQG